MSILAKPSDSAKYRLSRWPMLRRFLSRHFGQVASRRAAGAELLNLLAHNERSYRDPVYVPDCQPPFDVSTSRVKFIAYYLPQFYPIAENDAWWGKGFTEWTNVTRALPQFPGHYQPHLPADLGFYDLRVPETLERQVELARRYGIAGFCFYYYWFGGRRLLDKPLNLFAASPNLNLGFCLCWANGSWTRRWDSSPDILMAQEHTPDSDASFIVDVLSFMQDPRYITIDGRPLLIIYRAALLPEAKATAERWRDLTRKRIGKDLFLVYALTHGTRCHPKEFGFDAAVQFPPHNILDEIRLKRVRSYRTDFRGSAFDYASIPSVIGRHLSQYDFPVIPCVFPSWDDTPRRTHKAVSFVESTPQLYAEWLATAAEHAVRKPVGGASIVAINAWNEWAEGAHLEPDQRFGHAYLRATAEVLRPYCTT